MDDNAFPYNITDGTGAHFPLVCAQFNFAGAIFTDRHIADVSKVEFTFSPFSVRYVRGIPMSACRCPVRRTTIAALVDMNSVNPRRGVLDLNGEGDCVAGLFKTAVPVTSLPLAEPMVAVACFDGFEEVPFFCDPSQLAKKIETPTSRDRIEAFLPKDTKRFFILKSSILKVKCRKTPECLVIVAQSC